MFFCLVLGKEKLNILVTSSELYLVFFYKFTQHKGQKKTYLLLLWTLVGRTVGYQAWQEFFSVWLKFDLYQMYWVCTSLKTT